MSFCVLSCPPTLQLDGLRKPFLASLASHHQQPHTGHTVTCRKVLRRSLLIAGSFQSAAFEDHHDLVQHSGHPVDFPVQERNGQAAGGRLRCQPGLPHGRATCLLHCPFQPGRGRQDPTRSSSPPGRPASHKMRESRNIAAGEYGSRSTSGSKMDD